MDIEYVDNELRRLVEHGTTTDRMYLKYARDKKFLEALTRRVAAIKLADDYSDLYVLSFLHYEVLKHQEDKRTPFRILNNRVERVICKEMIERIQLVILEIDDTHYGKKK